MDIQKLFAERIGGAQFGQSTAIYKFEKIKRAKRAAKEAHPGVEMLDFGVGEPDQMAPRAIRQALKKAVDDPANRGYADNGIAEFKAAAAKYMADFFGVADLDPATEINHTIGSKPALAIANVGDGDPVGAGCGALRAACAEKGIDLLAFCAPLEAEIAALPPADQAGFLKDYGLTEPARDRLIRTAYRTLNLISFFTVGEDEVRAWTIRRGDNAVTAAGKIHTDLARGFIRAETVASDVLIEKKTHAACREAGQLRLEGKNYVVQDGDVIEIRANA